MKRLSILFVAIILISCNSTKDTVNTNESQRVEQRQKGQRGQRNGGERPNPETLMTQMDTNKDNKLSKKEVRGPLQNDFSKIDINNDGFISLEELKKGGQRPPRRN